MYLIQIKHTEIVALALTGRVNMNNNNKLTSNEPSSIRFPQLSCS